MTTKPATVQWPPGTECSRCPDAAVDEINGEPVCGTCYDEIEADAQYEALNQIANILRSGAATLAEIAGIIGSTGREIPEADDIQCGLSDETRVPVQAIRSLVAVITDEDGARDDQNPNPLFGDGGQLQDEFQQIRDWLDQTGEDETR